MPVLIAILVSLYPVPIKNDFSFGNAVKESQLGFYSERNEVPRVVVWAYFERTHIDYVLQGHILIFILDSVLFQEEEGHWISNMRKQKVDENFKVVYQEVIRTIKMTWEGMQIFFSVITENHEWDARRHERNLRFLSKDWLTTSSCSFDIISSALC